MCSYNSYIYFVVWFSYLTFISIIDLRCTHIRLFNFLVRYRERRVRLRKVIKIKNSEKMVHVRSCECPVVIVEFILKTQNFVPVKRGVCLSASRGFTVLCILFKYLNNCLRQQMYTLRIYIYPLIVRPDRLYVI